DLRSGSWLILSRRWNDLDIHFIAADRVSGALVKASAKSVVGLNRRLGPLPVLRREHARTPLDRGGERFTAHAARRDEHARVVADSPHLGDPGAGSEMHVAVAVEPEPNGRGHRRAVALESHDQAVLVSSQMLESARRRIISRLSRRATA